MAGVEQDRTAAKRSKFSVRLCGALTDRGTRVIASDRMTIAGSLARVMEMLGMVRRVDGDREGVKREGYYTKEDGNLSFTPPGKKT